MIDIAEPVMTTEIYIKTKVNYLAIIINYLIADTNA